MLVKRKIDFEKLKADNLNETFLGTFAADVEYVLAHMLDRGFNPRLTGPGRLYEEDEETAPQVRIKGAKEDLEAFANVLEQEKAYALKYLDVGLGSPELTEIKIKLEKSIYNFEKVTGLKWPLR
jgi:hypothetical protein